MNGVSNQEMAQLGALCDQSILATAAAQAAGFTSDDDSESAVGRMPVASSGVVLTSGAEISMSPIEWLWTGWLARGKLHLLAGAPGQGKTTIALALAATVTTGGYWPDGTQCPRGNVLIWSGEDDPGDTLLPRLIAMGADRSRVYFVTGTRKHGRMMPFDPAADLPNLKREVMNIGAVRLMIVDPIVSAVNGDSHKNAEVRRSLQPLVDLANDMRTAVLGITHLAKGTADRDPTERVVGSIAFTAIVRLVMLAAKAPTDDDKDRRILVRSKSNIGPDGGGFEYFLEMGMASETIQASTVKWGHSLEGTAQELLGEASEATGVACASTTALDTAKDFLYQVLADGLVPTKTVEAEAKAAGVALGTLRRASESLGVVKRKGSDAWYWRLPDWVPRTQDAPDAQDPHADEVAHVEPAGDTDGPDEEVI